MAQTKRYHNTFISINKIGLSTIKDIRNRGEMSLIKRAGVILVYQSTSDGDQETYYGFGIDRDTLKLIDFGGHWEAEDTSLYHTAKREFEEESLAAFDSLFEIDVNYLYAQARKGLAIFDDYTLEIFVNLSEINMSIGSDISKEELSLKFQEIVQQEAARGGMNAIENISLIWLTTDQVRKLLNENPDFIYYRLWKVLGEWFL